MLKITIQNGATSVNIKVEGKLAGPWVDELERCWRAIKDGVESKVMWVDLCEITFVDAGGRRLLTGMYEEGVQFKTFGCMAKGIVEEIVQEASRSR
jgi:hypothetical protein